MEKLLELKKHFDEKLENKTVALGVVLGSFVAYLVLSLILNKIEYNFTVFRNVLYMIQTLIWMIAVIVAMYVIHYYSIKKPIINLNKYVLFFLGLIIYLLFTYLVTLITFNIGYLPIVAILEMYFGNCIHYIVNTIIGVVYAFNAMRSVVDSITSFGHTSEIAYIAQAIRLAISCISDLIVPLGIVFIIVLEVKPDFFKNIFTSNKPADYKDYADMVDDKEVTQEDLMNQELDKSLASLNMVSLESSVTAETIVEKESNVGTLANKDMVQMYMITNMKYYPAEKIMHVREKLESMSDDDFMMVYAIDVKDPSTLLLISIFLGGFGIDRFMLGDIGMGVLKLLTAGCCGILTIIDWFTISKKTKESNFNKLMNL